MLTTGKTLLILRHIKFLSQSTTVEHITMTKKRSMIMTTSCRSRSKNHKHVEYNLREEWLSVSFRSG